MIPDTQYEPIIYYVLVELDSMDSFTDLMTFQTESQALQALKDVQELNNGIYRIIKLTEEVMK